VTKIGKTMKKLTKSKNPMISKRANRLIEKWKKIVENKKSSKEKGKIKMCLQTYFYFFLFLEEKKICDRSCSASSIGDDASDLRKLKAVCVV
jgi:hypothetical protein